MKAKRAILYVRVSTGEQTNENQAHELAKLAAQRGWLVIGRIEETVSGAAAARPGLARVLELAHKGAVDVVAVWALDRIGRSMHATIRTVLELERAGVELVSMREAWLDTSGPVRSLLVAIFGWVAQQEREQLSARTRAGLERAKRSGAKLGRPTRMPHETAARALLEQGKSVRTVARELGVTRGAVQGWIERARSAQAAVDKILSEHSKKGERER